MAVMDLLRNILLFQTHTHTHAPYDQLDLVRCFVCENALLTMKRIWESREMECDTEQRERERERERQCVCVCLCVCVCGDDDDD